MKDEKLQRLKQAKKLIEVLIEKFGISQSEIGRSIDLNQSSLTRVRKLDGEISKLKVIAIQKLIEKLEKYRQETNRKPVSKNLQSIKIRGIPVINRVSCGAWIDTGDMGYPGGHAEELYPASTSDPDAFFVIANGDSMIGADISDGALLLVEPNKPVDSGNLVLCQRSDQGVTIKKFTRPDPNTVILSPMNPAYQPIVLKEEEITSARFYRISAIVKRL